MCYMKQYLDNQPSQTPIGVIPQHFYKILQFFVGGREIYFHPKVDITDTALSTCV